MVFERVKGSAVPVVYLVLAMTVAAPAAAQTRTLDPGTRVRVQVNRQSTRFIGEIATVFPDTIILTVPNTRLGHRAVAVREIRQLEVSNGHRRLTAIGLIVGALAGGGLVAAYNGVVQSQCFRDCPKPASGMLGAAIGGIAVGGALHFVKQERWLTIAVPRPR